MDLGSLLQAFAAVFPAELPDKSMFATLALVARHRRPLAVWLGVSGAFVLHVAVAVLAGGLLGLLPESVVGAVTALLFGIGAIILFRAARNSHSSEEATGKGSEGHTAFRVGLTAFGVIAVAEWGDLTQLASAALASRSPSPLSIGIGAWLALITVAGIAVTLGRRLADRIPLQRINYLAAAVFTALFIWALVDLIAKIG